MEMVQFFIYIEATKVIRFYRLIKPQKMLLCKTLRRKASELLTHVTVLLLHTDQCHRCGR